MLSLSVNRPFYNGLSALALPKRREAVTLPEVKDVEPIAPCCTTHLARFRLNMRDQRGGLREAYVLHLTSCSQKGKASHIGVTKREPTCALPDSVVNLHNQTPTDAPVLGRVSRWVRGQGCPIRSTNHHNYVHVDSRGDESAQTKCALNAHRYGNT